MAKAEKNPVFAPVFGESWASLPPVMQKHYANRAHSRDVVVMTGVMQFEASRLARFLSPLFRLGGMLPMFSANNVPVTVQIASKPDSDSVVFHREIRREGRKSVVFITTMQPVGENRLIDWTAGNIGWHMEMTYADGNVTMRHCGYNGRLGKRICFMPLGWLLGECNAHEKVIDENRFSMGMEIRKNGKLFYGYSGEFEIARVIRLD